MAGVISMQTRTLALYVVSDGFRSTVCSRMCYIATPGGVHRGDDELVQDKEWERSVLYKDTPARVVS